MVGYLVDTNVISEIRRGKKSHPAVVAWFATVADEDLHFSVATIGEILRGIAHLRRRNPAKAHAISAWLEELRSLAAARILPIDLGIAVDWARITAHRTVPVVDGLLAATARVHQLTLATRDVAAVADLNVSLINPFEFMPGR